MSEPTSTAERPIDLPTGEPIPTGPDAATDTTSAASSSEKKPTIQTNNNNPPKLTSALKGLLLSLPSNTDAFLTHLQRCLATPSGIDTLLLFICYTSRLSGAVLSSVSQVLLRRSARDLVALAFALPPKTTILFTTGGGNVAAAGPSTATVAKTAVAQLAALVATRLKNLGSLASEARTIARLWALVGMYFWAKRLVLGLISAKTTAQEEGDEGDGTSSSATTKKLVAAVDWIQFLSCAAFQVLENGAYLSGRGVLGWTPNQQGRAYVVGARWLAVYTGLEIGKLLAKMTTPATKTAGMEQSAEDKAAMEAVRRSMAINLAWTPLTVHWSTEGGLISDGLVGLGGCIPGIIQMRKLWQETAQ